MKGTVMNQGLQTVPATKVSRRFGFYYDEAITSPIAIERNGAARVVMMPAAEYERLARQDHEALLPMELSDEEIRLIRNTEAPGSSKNLNHLMDEAEAD